MTCGIYEIVNIVTGKRYVGSSVDIESRWSGHRHRMRNGTSTNKKLQAAVNKYGLDSFSFSIIEVCSRENLIAREQYHIDERSEYNIRRIADSNIGRVIPDDEKALRSESAKKTHAENPNLATETSQRFKKLWKDDNFKLSMSEKISEAARVSWSDPDKKSRRLSFMNDEYKARMSIINSGVDNPNHDNSHYEFINIDGSEFYGTKMDFYKYYVLDKSHVSKLCNGKIKSHKGWTLKKAPD